jgi:hypothetical protein
MYVTGVWAYRCIYDFVIAWIYRLRLDRRVYHIIYLLAYVNGGVYRQLYQDVEFNS